MPEPRDADARIEAVYDELRRLAARFVRAERDQGVQATELVHEAYLRLAQGRTPEFSDRSHFIAIAAIAMRRLLVEQARARKAAKRGGQRIQVTLDESLLSSESTGSLDLLALDDALGRLAALDPEQARIVELRYFGGLTVDETAAVMGTSAATVKRHWTMARTWLFKALEGHTA